MTPREKPPFYRDSPTLGFLSLPDIYYTILDEILTVHISRDRDLSDRNSNDLVIGIHVSWRETHNFNKIPELIEDEHLVKKSLFGYILPRGRDIYDTWRKTLFNSRTFRSPNLVVIYYSPRLDPSSSYCPQ